MKAEAFVNLEENKGLAEFCFIVDKMKRGNEGFDRVRRRSIELHAVGGKGEEGEIPLSVQEIYLGRYECYSNES
jgi:hypothetical protein